jgi:hypothetical protein
LHRKLSVCRDGSLSLVGGEEHRRAEAGALMMRFTRTSGVLPIVRVMLSYKWAMAIASSWIIYLSGRI